MCEAACLACAAACLPFLRVHAGLLHAPSDLAADALYPYFDTLRRACLLLSSAARSRHALSDLLADSTHVSQRELSTGVFEVRAAAVLAEQPCERHRARLLSASGVGAGAWLEVMPVSDRLRAAPRLFWLALCMRLGMPVADLLPVGGRAPACRACSCEHDVYGRHPSVCSGGNRASMYTIRHDAVQSALLWVYRVVGLAASAVARPQSWRE